MHLRLNATVEQEVCENGRVREEKEGVGLGLGGEKGDTFGGGAAQRGSLVGVKSWWVAASRVTKEQ